MPHTWPYPREPCLHQQKDGPYHPPRPMSGPAPRRSVGKPIAPGELYRLRRGARYTFPNRPHALPPAPPPDRTEIYESLVAERVIEAALLRYRYCHHQRPLPHPRGHTQHRQKRRLPPTRTHHCGQGSARNNALHRYSIFPSDAPRKPNP